MLEIESNAREFMPNAKTRMVTFISRRKPSKMQMRMESGRPSNDFSKPGYPLFMESGRMKMSIITIRPVNR
jgi:hypothetical protein